MESFSNISSKKSTNFVTSPNVTSKSSTTYYEGVNHQGIPLQEKRDGQSFYEKTEKPKKDNCHFCCEHRSLRKHRERIMYRRPEKFILKRKRRIIFTTQQILALEKIFNKKPYVNRQEREFLMERLNVSERVINLWFRNRRRLSGYSLETADNCISDSSEGEGEKNFNLDYVQSRMNEPDEFGYVTLDDRAMKDLVTVIDSLLTDVILTDGNIKLRNETSLKLLNYEPVSPVSFHGNVEEIRYPKCELYDPQESLKRLFDVQALITK